MSGEVSLEPYVERLVALSEFVHAHPELGYEERESSAAVADLLESSGFTVTRGVGGLPTAFRATAGQGSLHVVVCCEYDALPDVGHACGHNLIAASSAGAGLALLEHLDEADLRVTVLGTPSEEGGGGKIDLIHAGEFDDAHFAMMVHPWPDERLEAQCLAVDHFDVIYEGREAHASAAPWEGINALDAQTIAQVAVGLLRQHLRPGDQVHSIISDGGVAANIVPQRTVARYMARSVDLDRLDALRQRLTRCFEAGALATGSRLEQVEIGSRFSHMVSHPGILAHYRQAAEALGRRFDADDEGRPRPTLSTDMANVSLVVPSIHPLIRLETHGAVNHQPEFTASCLGENAEATLRDGALALAATALTVARDENLRTQLLGGH
ncbi:MAG: M20 family metallopeptidase [Acidobacteria bacterium]|nr:M20 family metallopeptidase [Acidobacteriota bacterium]